VKQPSRAIKKQIAVALLGVMVGLSAVAPVPGKPSTNLTEGESARISAIDSVQVEPPPPVSRAVEDLLTQARDAAAGDQPAKALALADRALDEAKRHGDIPGQAKAHRARARALADLDRDEEALLGWQAAADAWQKAGDGPGQIEALSELAVLLLPDLERASPYLDRVRAIGEAESRRPLAVAKALWRGDTRLFERIPKEQAQELLEVALAQAEKKAPDSLLVILILERLTWTAPLPEERVDLARRAVALAEQSQQGPEVMAESLSVLAQALRRQKDYSAAEAELHRARLLLEESAPSSRVLGIIFIELGQVYYLQENYEQAEDFLLSALTIQEKAGDNPARVLNELGIVSAQQGKLAESRAYFTRVMHLDEKHNPGSFGASQTLRNLGIVAEMQRDFGSAHEYYARALAIEERVGKDSPGTLYQLTMLALELGDLVAARDNMERALARWKDAEKAPRALGLQSAVEREAGHLELAKSYLERALILKEETDPSAAAVAGTLDDLCEIALRQEQLDSAEAHCHRALKIYTEHSPTKLIDGTLSKLGEVYQRKTEHDTALEFHGRALTAREDVYGETHPLVAQSLLAIAESEAALGRTGDAFEKALRAERIGREHLEFAAGVLSEREGLLFAAVRESGLDLALTLGAVRTEPTTDVAGRLWDAVIRSRAVVLDTMAMRQHAASRAMDAETRSLAEAVSEARARLARLVVHGARDDPPERYHALVEHARKSMDAAERALAARSVAFREAGERNPSGLEEVIDHLPPGAALVGYVRYTNRAPSEGDRGKSSYLAFVYRSGAEGGGPSLVCLGEADPIDELVGQLRRQVVLESLDPGRSPGPSEAAYHQLGTRLRRLIWDPVVAGLGGVERLLLVPDGQLHLLSFAGLPADDSGYVLDEGPTIHYLATERDLVPSLSTRRGTGLLALGHPAFDEATLFAALLPEGKNRQPVPGAQVAHLDTFRGNHSSCGYFDSLRFASLPASEREVEEIASLWMNRTVPAASERLRGGGSPGDAGGILVLKRADANERQLKLNAGGKRVLHLATHGFFLGGQCESALEASRRAMETGGHLVAAAENPLLLSGLAMAGANHRWAAGMEEEDGILTAEEITSLDLEGVEWAVLSACETGVGDIHTSEGVLGLRRAFQVAGVRTVIMSLWPVQDTVARRWMRTLYEARFARGLGTTEAMHAAAHQMLQQRREASQNTHPFYWAGFVATGDWR
jgi:tetratricopeptide (TPR) repeat protein